MSTLSFLIPAFVSFALGMLITPFVSHFLYTYKCWKKRPGKETIYGTEAQVFNALKKEGEQRTPRMGGIIIWGSALLATVLLQLLQYFFGSEFQYGLLSRSQTWIPVATLIVGAVVGLLNDVYDILGVKHGLRLSRRLLIIAILSLLIALWMYVKVEVVAISIPFIGVMYLGIFIIPFFVFFMLGVYASGVIDGIDGLSGGVFASCFTGYAFIAYSLHQYDLAAFCAVIVGSVLAFLWFNIPPARFYMSETGTMALTLTLGVVAFMTDSLAGGLGFSAFILIGFPLWATVVSVLLQLFWRAAFGTKLFRIAPLHHHFEAIGWSSEKVTMRYWIVSIVCTLCGVIVALVA
jgi:phospho-N-acetylmuramoyl-pentapeptide-transferase